MAKIIEKAIELVCLDWDHTLTKIHTHNMCFDKFSSVLNRLEFKNTSVVPSNYNANPEIIGYAKEIFSDKEASFSFPVKILATISTLLKQGKSVAIVSYNNYPEIIYTGLELIGLNQEQLSQINVICGFPKNRDAGKEEHIRCAMELLQNISIEQVLLVDDDYNNCSKADNIGAKTLLASEFNMPKLMDLVSTMIFGENNFVMGDDSAEEVFMPLVPERSEELEAS
jgi:hypothetical protein